MTRSTQTARTVAQNGRESLEAAIERAKENGRLRVETDDGRTFEGEITEISVKREEDSMVLEEGDTLTRVVFETDAQKLLFTEMASGRGPNDATTHTIKTDYNDPHTDFEVLGGQWRKLKGSPGVDDFSVERIGESDTSDDDDERDDPFMRASERLKDIRNDMESEGSEPEDSEESESDDTQEESETRDDDSETSDDWDRIDEPCDACQSENGVTQAIEIPVATKTRELLLCMGCRIHLSKGRFDMLDTIDRSDESESDDTQDEETQDEEARERVTDGGENDPFIRASRKLDQVRDGPEPEEEESEEGEESETSDDESETSDDDSESDQEETQNDDYQVKNANIDASVNRWTKRGHDRLYVNDDNALEDGNFNIDLNDMECWYHGKPTSDDLTDLSVDDDGVMNLTVHFDSMDVMIAIEPVDESESDDSQDESESDQEESETRDEETPNTVRIITGINGVMHTPEITEGELSSTGKTISVEHTDKSYRLDADTILDGGHQYRDSRYFTLYTPERLQRKQRANKAPGPQAGADGVTDVEELPEPTHTVDDDSESEESESDDTQDESEPDQDETQDDEEPEPLSDDIRHRAANIRNAYLDDEAERALDVDDVLGERYGILSHLDDVAEGRTGDLDETKVEQTVRDCRHINPRTPNSVGAIMPLNDAVELLGEAQDQGESDDGMQDQDVGSDQDGESGSEIDPSDEGSGIDGNESEPTGNDSEPGEYDQSFDGGMTFIRDEDDL